MNTQTRYRTLVSHLAKVYAADESARTVALHEGLDEIVAKIQPDGAGAWKQVKADSQRLLKVWMARETRPGDAELAAQILDALDEFATDAAVVAAVAAVIVTPPEPASSAPDVEIVSVVEKPVTVKVEPSPVVKVVAPAPAPAPVAAPVKVPALPTLVVEEKPSTISHVPDDEEGEAVEEEEVQTEDGEAEEEEVVEEEEEEVVEEEVEEEVVEEEVEEEVVEEEEVEATEEEEEGMEVEKKIFRGRAYWLDVKTNKLYTVVGDDDVGDEVGKIVDGRPVFLAAAR
jgi:hypothetical protein